MRRGGVAFAFAFALAAWVGAPAAAGAGEAQRAFQEGLICYGELNFPCARDKLDQARAAADPGAVAAVEIERYLGLTHLALGDEEQARAAFYRMLNHDPLAELTPDRHPPLAVELFAQAQAAWRRDHPPPPPVSPPPTIEPPPLAPTTEPPPEPPPIVETPPPPVPRHRLGPRLGAALLGGREATRFGPGVTLEADYAHGFGETGWFVGATAGAQVHPVLDGPALTALSVSALGGWERRFGRWALRLPLGLGPLLSGRGAPGEDVGLLWRVHPEAGFRPGDHPALPEWMLGLGPRGAVLLNRRGASTYFVADLAAAWRW